MKYFRTIHAVIRPGRARLPPSRSEPQELPRQKPRPTKISAILSAIVHGKKPTAFLFHFAALCAWLLPLPALSQNARLPYHQIYQAQKAQSDWNQTHTNLLVVLTMQSVNPEIKTTDLAVYIESKSGKIPVEIRPQGDFAIPVTDDLLSEDPWIITNQPKGTMRLNWRLGLLPGRLEKTLHYARLMRPVRDSEEIQAQMRNILPGSPPMMATGLKLKFAPTQNPP